MNGGKVPVGHKIVDFLVLLIQVSYGQSLIGVWLFDWMGLPYPVGNTIFMMMIYLFRFGRIGLHYNKTSRFVYIFLLVYAFDVLQGVYYMTSLAIWRLCLLIDVYFFINYVVLVYKEYKACYGGLFTIKNVIKPYLTYSLYNVIIVILSAILLLAGILSITDNPIAENSLLADNIEGGTQYFQPGHLSLVSIALSERGLFPLPMLTGLSHEPHVLCYLILPSFFLFLSKYYNSKKQVVALYVAYLLIVLLAFATTAVLAFVVAIVLEQLWFIMIKKSTLRIVLLVITLLIATYFAADFINTLYGEVMTKVSEEGGSKDYSLISLQYLVTPRGIIGRGNIPNGYGYRLLEVNNQVGLITCILDISLYLVLLIKSFKLYKSRFSTLHYFGLAFLYYLMHSLKLSFQMFTIPYFAFIIALMYIVELEKKEIERKG